MPTTGEYSQRTDLAFGSKGIVWALSRLIGTNVEVLTTENERLRGILDTFGVNATVVLMDLPKQSQKQVGVNRVQDKKILSTIIQRDDLVCLKGWAPKQAASSLDLRFIDKAIAAKSMGCVIEQGAAENKVPGDLVPWEDESPPLSSSANVCGLDGDNESGWDSGNMLSTFEKANPGKTSYLGMEQYTNVEVPIDLPEVKIREISELVDSIVPTDDDFLEDNTRTEEQKFAAVDRPAAEPPVQPPLVAPTQITTHNDSAIRKTHSNERYFTSRTACVSSANGRPYPGIARRHRYPRNAGNPAGSMRYSPRYNRGEGSPQANGAFVRGERGTYPFPGYGGDGGSQSARSSPYPRRAQPARPAFRPSVRQGTASWRYSRNRYQGHPSLPIEVARVNSQLHGSPAATTYYYNQANRLVSSAATNHFPVNTSSTSDTHNTHYAQSFPVSGHEKTPVNSSPTVDPSAVLQSSHPRTSSQPPLPDPPSDCSMSQQPNYPPNPLPIIAASVPPRPRGLAVNLSAIGTNTQFPATMMGPFSVTPLLRALPVPPGASPAFTAQPTRLVSLQFPHEYPAGPHAVQQAVPPAQEEHLRTSGVEERPQYLMYPEDRNSALLADPASGACVATAMEGLRPLVSPGAPPRKAVVSVNMPVVENPFASGAETQETQPGLGQVKNSEETSEEDGDAEELARRTFVITSGDFTTTTTFYATPTNLVEMLGEPDKTISLDSIDPNMVIDDSFELPPHLEAQRATAACTKPYAFSAASEPRPTSIDTQRQPHFQQFQHLSSPHTFQNPQQYTGVLQASGFQQNPAASQIPSFASAQGLQYSPAYYIVNPVAFSATNNPAASLIAPSATPATALYQSAPILPPYPFCGYPSNQPSFNILPLTSSFPSAQAAAFLMNNAAAATGTFIPDHHYPIYQGQLANGHPFRHPQHYGATHDPMAGGSLRRTRYPTAASHHHTPRRYSENINRPNAPNANIRRGETVPVDSAAQPNRAARVNSSSTVTDPEPVRNASESKEPNASLGEPTSHGLDRRRPYLDHERAGQGDQRRGYNRRMGNQLRDSPGGQTDMSSRGPTHVDRPTAPDSEQHRFHGGAPARRGYYSSSRGAGTQDRRGKPHDPHRPR